MENVLSGLPVELLDLISSFLPNHDIKSLRLTCRVLGKKASLRLSRVFLSANPLNIQVFRAIADHETIRKRVTEIIWDDARLIKEPEMEEFHPAEPREDLYIDPDEGCPTWFVEECKGNIKNLRRRKNDDVDRPDHIARAEQVAAQLPLKTCWQYYQNLLQEQGEVCDFQSDVDTFIYGLKQFPGLKRITITPAAHGWLFAPFYETPMIRSFPHGFNYPIPRGWPTSGLAQTPPYAFPWEDEAEKNKWRGFRMVMRLLAQQEHNISELVINVNQLPTGLNCRIFDRPCEEYNSLVALLKRPGFCHLDLAMIVRGQERQGWPSFRSGYLRQALSEASDLQYFAFRTTVDPDTIDDAINEPGSPGSHSHFIPLQTIFPVNRWSNLHHFWLSRFIVMQSDLISLLTALPNTLRSLELSFLDFLEDGGSWRDLLTEIRDVLRWHERDMVSRPKVIVGLDVLCPEAGFGIWIENEVRGFLYENGPNPFTEGSPNNVLLGVGVERDTFEPEHERPNVKPSTLARMGYYKKNRYIRD